LRNRVKIGSKSIIGLNVEIITASHNIDSTEWEFKAYGIEIAYYCWLATNTLILPSCRKIGYGAVCSAGSVVAGNVEPLSVVSGNPAIHLRFRKVVHSDLVVESLLGNDFIRYFKTYFSR
jgi:acetyltransferase-like isoleucine patch superfamily enzyme